MDLLCKSTCSSNQIQIKSMLFKIGPNPNPNQIHPSKKVDWIRIQSNPDLICAHHCYMGDKKQKGSLRQLSLSCQKKTWLSQAFIWYDTNYDIYFTELFLSHSTVAVILIFFCIFWCDNTKCLIDPFCYFLLMITSITK